MIEVVEEEVEFAACGEARGLGDEGMVGRVKPTREAPKHGSNSQVKLMMAIERGRVIGNCE